MLLRLRRGQLGGILSRRTPDVHFFTPSATDRSFSYESGRGSKGGKKDGDEPVVGEASQPSTTTPAPAANNGRRRTRRAVAAVTVPVRGAELPFTPLLPDHLGHANPASLLRDAFFSAGRPLLEVEVPEHFRRRAGPNPSNDPADAQQGLAVAADDAHTGAPSDPAFKAPRISSLVPPAPRDVEDDVFGAPDPHDAYLISDPDGLDPDVPGSAARYLASCEALVPPPSPLEEVIEVEDLKRAEDEARRRGRKSEWDDETVRKAAFLAPFGLHPPKLATGTLESTLAHQVLSHHHDAAHRPAHASPLSLPTLDQSPHTLTMTAARYLHSGLVAHQYASATEWASVCRSMDAGQRRLLGRPADADAQTTRRLPGVTGASVGSSSPTRRQRRRQKASPANADGIVERLRGLLSRTNADLAKLVNVGDVEGVVVVEIDLGALQNPAPIVEAPRHGQQEDDEGKGEFKMDSVFRKRKRKMNVHKYKKRRKARRVLKKRLGK